MDWYFFFELWTIMLEDLERAIQYVSGHHFLAVSYTSYDPIEEF